MVLLNLCAKKKKVSGFYLSFWPLTRSFINNGAVLNSSEIRGPTFDFESLVFGLLSPSVLNF